LAQIAEQLTRGHQDALASHYAQAEAEYARWTQSGSGVAVAKTLADVDAPATLSIVQVLQAIVFGLAERLGLSPESAERLATQATTCPALSRIAASRSSFDGG
jgi:hypothetical protein